MWGGNGSLVIQACAGGVCANIAGEFLRKYDLGAVGNTISGVLGGALAAQIAGALAGGAGNDTLRGDLDIGSIVGHTVSGAVGGGVLMMIIGLAIEAIRGPGIRR
jgi:hypothetical protein